MAHPAKSALTTAMPAPLEGLRMLDFSRLLPGPLATRMMAEQGAEVIKIEHPTRRDPLRGYPPFVGKRNAYDLVLNAGKRHLLADPNTEAGLELLFRLIEQSDVVLESFRPGVMASMGLGPEDCLRRNPRLVYASLTGFGQRGKNADLAGHDLNFQALSGILHWSRDAEGRLQHPGLPLADIAGGSYGTVQAILAALWQRERSGTGRHLDLSMTAAVAPLASLALATHQASAMVGLPDVPPQSGTLSGGLARYGLYACKDGKWMALAALEPKFWQRFCTAVDRKEWADRLSFSIEDQASMRIDLQKLFRSKTQAEWTEIGRTADCCLSPVMEPEAFEASQEKGAADAAETWWSREAGAGLTLFPAGSGTATGPRSTKDGTPSPEAKSMPAPVRAPMPAAPLPGQDSRSIMEELGYSQAAQKALLDAGAVALQ